jgi:dGTPase
LVNINDLPKDALEILGKTHSQRIDTMVTDMINESRGKDEIQRSLRIYEATQKLRKYLFENVYFGSLAKVEESKAKRLIKLLYRYYQENISDIPKEFRNRIEDSSKEQIIIDYIAGMSDRYAIKVGKDIYIPEPWFVK